MLRSAAGDPERLALVIELTVWANAAHGLVMLIATPLQKGLVMTSVESLPLFGIALVLWQLQPRRSSLERSATGAGEAAASAARFVAR